MDFQQWWEETLDQHAESLAAVVRALEAMDPPVTIAYQSLQMYSRGSVPSLFLFEAICKGLKLEPAWVVAGRVARDVTLRDREKRKRAKGGRPTSDAATEAST